MSQFGRMVGFALLGLVDGAVPAGLLAVTVLIFGPFARVTVVVAIFLGLVGLFVGATLGAVAAWRGGRPFPLARGAIRVWRRVLWFPLR